MQQSHCALCYLDNCNCNEETISNFNDNYNKETNIFVVSRSFQDFNGLTVTGKFDDETLQKMQSPRCGVPDNAPLEVPQTGDGPNSFTQLGTLLYFTTLRNFRLTFFSVHLAHFTSLCQPFRTCLLSDVLENSLFFRFDL